MSSIAAGTTAGSALVSTGDTTGNLVLQVNGTTPSVTLAANGSIGVGSTPAYGTSGQVLTSAGSAAAPTWATAASGLTLLATATASASATVSLETGIGATYDDYFVTFLDVTAATDDVELRVRLKFSGTYAVPLSSQGYYSVSDSVNVTKLTETSTCTINRGRVAIYTSTGKNVGGELYFNRTANAKYQMVRFRASSWSPNSYGTNIVSDNAGSGFWTNTNAVEGIQFYMSSGNIQSGTFRLYGIQNS